jgi:hypothetical protein
VIVVRSTTSVPEPALMTPVPFWVAKLSETFESRMLSVPTLSPSAWLAIAPALGSYTPGPGMYSIGSGSSGSITWAGSGIISPGFATIWLSSRIETVPFDELFTAAPDSPAALPEKVEPTISIVPDFGGNSGALVHS